MDQIKKSRRWTRAAVTKAVNALEAELAKDTHDHSQLTANFQILHTNYAKLIQQDEEMRNRMDEADVDDADMQVELDTMQQYIEKVLEVKWKVDKILHPPIRPPSPIRRPPSPTRPPSPNRPPSPSPSSASGFNSKKTYKLPKIKLKRFSGDLTEWLGWWAQFEKIHEDEDLHDTDKFQYLHQCMVPGSRAHSMVERYPQSKENYPKVISALKDRFGKSKLLTQVYVRELIKMIANRGREEEEKSYLATLYDKLESHLRSLESLGVTVDQMAKFLFPMVESCVPDDVFTAWQRSPLYEKDGSTEDPPKNELDYLLQFLKQEIDREEQRSLAKAGFGLHPEKKKTAGFEKKKSQAPTLIEEGPTAAGLFNGQVTKNMCIFCDKPHDSRSCFAAPKMTLAAREAKVNSKRVCKNCFKPGHGWKDCRSTAKCSSCNGKHHNLICRGEKPVKAQDPTPTVQSTLNCTAEVVLQTLMVQISRGDGNGTKLIRVLVDNGSQRSYIKRSTAEELGLKSMKSVTFNHALFGGAEAKNVHSSFQVQVQEIHGRFTTTMNVFDQQMLCGGIPKVTKGPWMRELRQKNIWVNDLGKSEPSEVEMLIGADCYGQLITGRVVQLSNGLTAIETRLGWTLMGELQTNPPIAKSVITMHITSASVPELWRLEAIGIHDPLEKKTRQQQELAAKNHFLQSVSRNSDGRYSVGLPWANGKVNIPNNRLVAERRLQNTTSKLASLNKIEIYGEVFKSWEEEDIVSECPPVEVQQQTVCHYLPHRAVVKESKTTPVRPVFDASCKLGRAPSLNDCLEKGPNLLELIPSILLRFRIGRIGVLSDIRKAFLMVEVNEEDRDFLRFLWWEDGKEKRVKTLRHNRVVFGLNCGPFLLGAVVEYHLSQVEEQLKPIAQKLLKSLYVDNCVTSLASLKEYEEFKKTSTAIMAEAKMDLRQWEYSHDNSTDPVTSVLGLSWDKSEDSLRCEVVPGDTPTKLTKRIILSKVQSIFDPLGFLCPALLVPKLILQKLWSEKGSWDAEIVGEYKSSYENWWSEMSTVLDKIKIPRNVTGGEELDRCSHQIHTFCDASKEAYSAVVFLRVESRRGVTVQLLQAKARVAPLKIATINRLELLSCTIAARLTSNVKEALSMENSTTFLWSDSSTALAWIKRNDDWGTFVGNRVREICSLSNPDHWRHVPGHLNPADLPRGCNPNKLLELAWWEGPEWLKADPSSWPSGGGSFDEEKILEEKKKVTICSMIGLIVTEAPWWMQRCSSYIKTVRVFAWVLRFTDKLRRKSHVHDVDLTSEEVNKAEKRIILLVQAEVFPQKSNVISGVRVNQDGEGIIRVVTKLFNRQDTVDFIRPALLPNTHPLVDLIIREEHLNNSHAGTQIIMGNLRERFWIIHSRRAINKIVKSCVICRRFASKSPSVPVAPLPEGRVATTGHAFETTGVDLAGPLYLKNGSKCYIVLFTCAVFRCVHLELVQTLTTEDFLMALVRFCKRKRRPTTIYSDNGTNFVGTVNLFSSIDWGEVKKRTQQQRIEWRFNPPAAPWWGGWWERLVRSIKDLLKRMLGFKKLTQTQLETCLCEVEAAFNSRPLMVVTEDQDDLIPLTPAMFITNLPEVECPESKLLKLSGLPQKTKNLDLLSQELRSRFRKEYLAQLV